MQLSDADTDYRVASLNPIFRSFIMFIPPTGPTNNVNTGCGNDNVHISKAEGLGGLLGLYKVDINGQTQYMTKQQLENTNFNLGAGNDTLVVDGNVNANIHANGGSGNDVMIGGNGNDVLKGGSGNDFIAGRGGNDHIEGNRGNDVLLGGNGNDHVEGGRGNDYVSGGNGNDWLQGGRGNDHLDGGRGNDFLQGGPGWDILHGGPGFDFKQYS
jgi:Ca2+-binding RTX toxin-like protein